MRDESEGEATNDIDEQCAERNQGRGTVVEQSADGVAAGTSYGASEGDIPDHEFVT